jgi:hypothetical protein
VKILIRSWPVVAAFILLCSVSFLRQRLSQGVKGTAAIVCILLLVHASRALRAEVRGRLRFYIVPFLLIPGMLAVWLGLNQLRVEFYDADLNRLFHNRTLTERAYANVVALQDAVLWIVGVLLLALSVAALYELARWLRAKLAFVRS